MNALTPLAVQNADVLRALRKPFEGLTPFAKAIGRDPSNTKKTLAALYAAQLIGPAALSHPLTDKGLDMVAALDRADGRFSGQSSASLAHFRTNPFNPRPELDFDVAGQEELGDTIWNRGVLQPLLVTQVDILGDGFRVLLDGERRFRALRRLIESGRIEPLFLIPYVEKWVAPEDLEAVTVELALIANGQGKPLPKLAEARGFAHLMAARGWTAKDVAGNVGKGVRLVQEAVHVIRKADPADIAALEAGEPGWNWERLRATVREEGGRGWDERRAIEQSPTPPATIEGGLAALAKADPAAAYDALVERVEREQPLPLAAPAAAPLADLSGREICTLVELADALARGGVCPVGKSWFGVPVHNAHLDATGADLVQKRLMQFSTGGLGLGWFAWLTEAGETWLAANGYCNPPLAGDLNRARYAAGQVQWPHAHYMTGFLNPAPPKPDAAGDDAQGGAQMDVEEEIKLKAATAAEAAVRGFLTERKVDRRASFAKVAADCGLRLPVRAGIDKDVGTVVAGEGTIVVTIDPDRTLPDSHALALAELFAWAINDAAEWSKWGD